MNPERIVRELDARLERPTRLIVYGRAALALGFDQVPAAVRATLDIDAILPEVEMAAIETDDQFWKAVEDTNRTLEPEGLYLTHLFSDSQVILTPDWLSRIQPVELDGLRCLRLFRPAVTDLILTKLMRVDPQDREDVLFLLNACQPAAAEVDIALKHAAVPDIPEIQEAFDTNIIWLRSIRPEP